MTDTYPPDPPGRMIALPTSGVALRRYAEETTLRQYTSPLPLLFELYRRNPSMVARLPLLVGSGVVWPYGGGVLVRVPNRPGESPMLRNSWTALHSSLAHVLIEHGAAGDDAMVMYHEPTVEPDDTGPGYLHRPRAFAVMSPAADLTGWGVWWAADGPAALYTPERTQFGGGRQTPATTVYPGLRNLDAALPHDHDGAHRVRWLSTPGGARLAEDARRHHAEAMRRAEQALAIARQAPPISAEQVRESFGRP